MTFEGGFHGEIHQSTLRAYRADSSDVKRNAIQRKRFAFAKRRRFFRRGKHGRSSQRGVYPQAARGCAA
ncbi:hypothetical protein D3C85_1635120 [compost metagenome]